MSLAFEVLPGRVLARVFAHQLESRRGPVPCLSYVTEGLRSSGQRELVFTIVRDAGATVDAAPRGPLAFLRAVAELAAQGRLVGPGHWTELGGAGLLGRAELRGVAYQAAWPMDGVRLPEGALAAIPLLAPELETVKRFGALRVLARLGRAAGFFPTAPWCDPDRAAIATPDEKTVLDGVACGFFEGVSAVLDGAHVVVRIEPAASELIARALPGLPPTAALALHLSLDPTADACLVWSPGQTNLEAITPHGSAGARASGCFVLFVPEQDYDGGNPFEDGFAMMLTDASWARLREALLSGAPLTIPGAANTKALCIETAPRSWRGAPSRA